MRVLIAGATGYLGGRLSDYLSLRGFEVIALLRTIPADEQWLNQFTQVVVGDISVNKTIEEIGCQSVDAVVYAISLNHFESENEIDQCQRINVAPLWRLLDQLSLKSLKRFIYISTQHVYGRTGTNSVNEESSVTPQNNYGLTHLMCENITRLYHTRNKISSINLRLSNGYGPPKFDNCDCWWLVINDFCKSAIETGQIQLKSDGSPQRDFININDINQAIELLLLSPERDIRYVDYNLGGGTTYTMLELAHIVSKCVEKKFQKSVPVLFPDGTISFDARQHLNIKKMRYQTRRMSELGFKPRTLIDDGVAEVFEYLKSF